MEVKYDLSKHPYQSKAFNSKKRFVACIAGVQCLEENEFVYTPTGLKLVKDIKDGDSILGGVVQDRYEFEDVIYEVRLNNGIRVRANKDHRFFVKTYRNDTAQWLTVEEIKNLEKKDGVTKVQLYDAKDFAKSLDSKSIKHAKLLGYMLSDGTFGKGQSAKFTNTRFEFIQDVVNLSQELDDSIKPRMYKKGNGWDVTLTDGNRGTRNPVKKYLDKLHITRNSFGEITAGDKESLIQFVQGYFNGNGSLVIYADRQDNRQDIYNIDLAIGLSRIQAYQMQYILWKLGVRSHIVSEQPEGKSLFYRVRVDRNSCEKLLGMLEWIKYSDKFYKASQIQTQNVRNADSWLSITDIKEVGEGKVVGWVTEDTHEIIGYCGMRGHNSGKSFLGSVWTLNKSRQYPKDYHLICAPSYKILKQSTLQKFFEIAPFYRKNYHKQDKVIDLPEGGKIFVRSADRPEGLEGMTLRSAWLDEAGQMKAFVWTIIQARVGLKKGQVLITSTPYKIGWMYRDIYKLWEKGYDEYDVYQWTSKDNPWFSDSEYERAKRDIANPKLFNRRYKGQFEKMENLVYAEFRQDENVVEKVDKDWVETIAGVDWAFTHPTAIVVVSRDKSGTYYVRDEFYETRKTTPEIIEKAKAFKNRYDISTFYADSAEPDRIKEFNDANLYTRPAEKDINFGIDKIRDLIRRDKLKVYSKCINTIDEFESYRYEQGTDSEGRLMDKRDKPIAEENHAMDSLRYCLYTSDPLISSDNVKPIKPIFQKY